MRRTHLNDATGVGTRYNDFAIGSAALSFARIGAGLHARPNPRRLSHISCRIRQTDYRGLARRLVAHKRHLSGPHLHPQRCFTRDECLAP